MLPSGCENLARITGLSSARRNVIKKKVRSVDGMGKRVVTEMAEPVSEKKKNLVARLVKLMQGFCIGVIATCFIQKIKKNGFMVKQWIGTCISQVLFSECQRF